MTPPSELEAAAVSPVMTAWTTRGDGIDALQPTRVPIPKPGPRELLVGMTAQSLNYRDLLIVNGHGTWQPPSPVVPVSDGVGIVTALGSDVTRFTTGERVSAMFLPHWVTGPLTRATYLEPVGGPINRGMLADYVLIHEEQAARVPQTLSDAEAATLPVAAVTAWHAVVERSQVRAGETVLIHGTGGVSLFALQFGLALGARVAITSSSADKLARVSTLGADLTLNYRTVDVAAAVLDWTAGEGVDHVIETIGGDNLNTSLRAVRIGGTISFIGLIAGLSAPINTYQFVTKNVAIHGIETGSHAMYEQMSQFIDERGIRPVIDSVHPLAEARDAFRLLESGNHFGKLVLVSDTLFSRAVLVR